MQKIFRKFALVAVTAMISFQLQRHGEIACIIRMLSGAATCFFLGRGRPARQVGGPVLHVRKQPELSSSAKGCMKNGLRVHR